MSKISNSIRIHRTNGMGKEIVDWLNDILLPRLSYLIEIGNGHYFASLSGHAEYKWCFRLPGFITVYLMIDDENTIMGIEFLSDADSRNILEIYDVSRLSEFSEKFIGTKLDSSKPIERNMN